MPAKRFLVWVPTLMWMGVIFWFSSRSASQAAQVDWLDFFIKKTAHFVEYFILAVLLSSSLANSLRITLKQLLCIALAVSICYAASDEYHQSRVPGREPRVRDVTIDTVGASTAVAILYLSHTRTRLGRRILGSNK